MTTLPITAVGDPVLRTPAAPLSPAELADPQTRRFIDDLIETKRAAKGAGLAAKLFVDRMTDLTTLTTWEQFERFRKREFLARVAEITERFGS